MLEELYVGVSFAGWNFTALPAAAAGGCRYSIVSLSRFGNGPVWNRGIKIAAMTNVDITATDPNAAQGFRGRCSIK